MNSLFYLKGTVSYFTHFNYYFIPFIVYFVLVACDSFYFFFKLYIFIFNFCCVFFFCAFSAYAFCCFFIFYKPLSSAISNFIYSTHTFCVYMYTYIHIHTLPVKTLDISTLDLHTTF